MQKEYGEDLLKFRTQCRENGMRITPQREAVYRSITGMTNHPSTEEVFRDVVRTIPAVSFDTVNRTLLTFAESGLIDVIESVSGVRRYEPHQHFHHHIHCTQCGKIVDFDYNGFDTVNLPESVRKEFSQINRRVSLSGICMECKKRERNNKL